LVRATARWPCISCCSCKAERCSCRPPEFNQDESSSWACICNLRSEICEQYVKQKQRLRTRNLH
jgi:hypothetical protein